MNIDITDVAGFIKLFNETSCAPTSFWALIFQFFFLCLTQVNGWHFFSMMVLLSEDKEQYN